MADPTKRLTIEGIYNHPWYTRNLPPGVREMNARPQPPPEGGSRGVGAGVGSRVCVFLGGEGVCVAE